MIIVECSNGVTLEIEDDSMASMDIYRHVFRKVFPHCYHLSLNIIRMDWSMAPQQELMHEVNKRIKGKGLYVLYKGDVLRIMRDGYDYSMWTAGYREQLKFDVADLYRLFNEKEIVFQELGGGL